MAINSLETAQRYTGELDKMLIQKSVVGFMEDNVLRAKFVGAKTVMMPDINFVGLANYDKDKGFAKGTVTVGHTSYELEKDRARQLQIDREDMDEAGISNLAGQILSEYVRTNVAPEMDAYVLSKLYGVAAAKQNVTVYTAETAYNDLINVINNVQSAAGYDSELVAFVDSEMYSMLMTTPEISRQIIISDFKQGNVDLKVKTLNGVAIIPVPDVRMKSEYEYLNNSDGEDTVTGGFTPAETAKSVHAIVLPKKAASLVKKTERMSIFTPEQNKDADAYVFNYRLYYDAFVKKSNLETIYAIAE